MLVCLFVGQNSLHKVLSKLKHIWVDIQRVWHLIIHNIHFSLKKGIKLHCQKEPEKNWLSGQSSGLQIEYPGSMSERSIFSR